MPGEGQLRIVEVGVIVPFEQDPTPIQEFLNITNAGRDGTRILLKGTVVEVIRGESAGLGLK